MVETASGERGWVDADDIADEVVAGDWPAVGTTVAGVVLGYTRDGRVRLATRPGYVKYVRESGDPGNGLVAWERLREADRSHGDAAHMVYESPDGLGTVRWALGDGRMRRTALRALVDAPTGVKLEFIDELVRLAISEGQEDDRRLAFVVLASTEEKLLAPVLTRLASDLATASLTETQRRHLMRLLRRLTQKAG
jgi:hypothetical protein